MSEVTHFHDFPESRYRRACGAVWVFFLGFVLCMVVPLIWNGWNRKALFQDPVWRMCFGSYLIASGFAWATFCRTLAKTYAIHARRSRLQRLLRRVFGDRREPPPQALYGELFMGIAAFSAFLVCGGIAFCADWIPHPR